MSDTCTTQAEDMAKFFSHSGLQTSLLSSNISELFEAAPMVKGLMRNGHSMDWTSYHPLEDMHSYLDYLEQTYDFVSTESIGQSYEGSDMRIIKVKDLLTDGKTERTDKRTDGRTNGRTNGQTEGQTDGLRVSCRCVVAAARATSAAANLPSGLTEEFTRGSG